MDWFGWHHYVTCIVGFWISPGEGQNREKKSRGGGLPTSCMGHLDPVVFIADNEVDRAT
jgi:hypothetical protein